MLYVPHKTFAVMGNLCRSKLVVDTFWGPGISSHPILDKYIVESLHQTFILHHDKQVTVAFLPCRIRIGFQDVSSGVI